MILLLPVFCFSFFETKKPQNFSDCPVPSQIWDGHFTNTSEFASHFVLCQQPFLLGGCSIRLTTAVYALIQDVCFDLTAGPLFLETIGFESSHFTLFSWIGIFNKYFFVVAEFTAEKTHHKQTIFRQLQKDYATMTRSRRQCSVSFGIREKSGWHPVRLDSPDFCSGKVGGIDSGHPTNLLLKAVLGGSSQVS